MISLYGLRNRREIVEALLLERYPSLGDLSPAAGDGAGQQSPQAARLLAAPKADAYVIDDLERCAMPIAEALGFLNQLVERDGRKMVILANEKRIPERADAADYSPAKEKVVGRSLAVRPDFEAALDSFLGLVDLRQPNEASAHQSSWPTCTVLGLASGHC